MFFRNRKMIKHVAIIISVVLVASLFAGILAAAL
jgi:hypothetical protein